MNDVSLPSEEGVVDTRSGDGKGVLKGAKKNAEIQLPRGETTEAELPVAGIFRLGVNRSGIKGRAKNG